ncbi:hypothetical protein LguiA_030854 [Lonicera macranthoides]
MPKRFRSLGKVMLIVGNKLPKVKRTSQQSMPNNKEKMAIIGNGNKQFDAKGDSALNKEGTMSRSSTEQKVNKIFQHFDFNRDGGLGPEEMAAFNLSLPCNQESNSDDKIDAIV